ncbi:MAG TPA: aldo/keto reductase, partial [Acidimicrobiales bacterium]|nr:aldo/keto reductase [Acidimicrobiales bacterium]
QPPYHMFHRDIESEILPYAAKNDIGVLVYGPLAHGLLAGAMTSDTTFPVGDWRRRSRDFHGDRFARNLQVVERLKVFGDRYGVPLAQLAVAWTVAHSAVDVAIVGARRPNQIEALVPAADIRLSAWDRRRLDHILGDAARVEGPSPDAM